jgi:hypothetical protein
MRMGASNPAIVVRRAVRSLRGCWRLDADQRLTGRAGATLGNYLQKEEKVFFFEKRTKKLFRLDLLGPAGVRAK